MFDFSAPSKTFLFGEYVALNGGPALLVTHAPRFSVVISWDNFKGPSGHLDPIFQRGLPGILWARLLKRHPKLNSVNLRFEDPFLGKGGFGASSAAYLFLSILQLSFEDPSFILETDFGGDLCELVWKMFNDDQGATAHGVRPSGYDLLSQILGGVCQISVNEGVLKTNSWPWPDMDYIILKTPEKLLTHEHLKRISLSGLGALTDISVGLTKSFLARDQESFLTGINSFSCALDEQGYVAPETQKWIQRLRSLEGVMALKGCGAMGLDVVCVFFDRSKAERVILGIPQELKLVARSENIERGLRVSNSKWWAEFAREARG